MIFFLFGSEKSGMNAISNGGDASGVPTGGVFGARSVDWLIPRVTSHGFCTKLE